MANKLTKWWKKWFGGTRTPSGAKRYRRIQRNVKRTAVKIRRRLPRRKGGVGKPTRSRKRLDIEAIAAHSTAIRWGVIVIALWLASDLVGRLIGVFLEPEYATGPKKPISTTMSQRPSQDFGAILRRNIFDMEGKIPDPFDPGTFDCFSQARPSRRNITLLGTIVMNDEIHSTALIQEPGSPLKNAVKKGDNFGGNKYQALEFQRKRLCFLVRSTQEYEFIEVKERPGILVAAGGSSSYGGRIRKTSESTYTVEKSFIDEKISNLRDVLSSARAVPYVRNGQFQGFLVQSIEPDSIFREIGIMQGDVLVGVNDIKLDNPGKGLEAFQKLRNSGKVELEIIRGGQKTKMQYVVK